MHPRVLAAGAFLLFSSTVSAVNWGFLQYSPTSHFTEQDWDLLREAGRKALMTGADGDIEGWTNPDTGAYGTIQPVSTEEREGSRFTFCKQKDGTWRVAQ
jgi:surface antigen